jgi:sterol-4alpha-carboxylate 3-dehydrogenase (decarboxylating)
VIGPHESNLIPIFANTPRGIEVGSGQQLFDFTSVENVALAHVLGLENLMNAGSANGKAFFITNCQPIPMRKFKEMLWHQLDENSTESGSESYPYWIIPIWLICFIVGTLDSTLRLFGKQTPLSVKEIGAGVTTRYYNNGLAKRILGYEPVVTLEESIKRACKTYKDMSVTRK